MSPNWVARALAGVCVCGAYRGPRPGRSSRSTMIRPRKPAPPKSAVEELLPVRRLLAASARARRSGKPTELPGAHSAPFYGCRTRCPSPFLRKDMFFLFVRLLFLRARGALLRAAPGQRFLYQGSPKNSLSRRAEPNGVPPRPPRGTWRQPNASPPRGLREEPSGNQTASRRGASERNLAATKRRAAAASPRGT